MTELVERGGRGSFTGILTYKSAEALRVAVLTSNPIIHRTTPALGRELATQVGVPVKLMKQVRDFTGGEVTLDEMLPDPAPPQSSSPTNEPPGPAPAKLANEGA